MLIVGRVRNAAAETPAVIEAEFVSEKEFEVDVFVAAVMFTFPSLLRRVMSPSVEETLLPLMARSEFDVRVMSLKAKMLLAWLVMMSVSEVDLVLEIDSVPAT